MKKRLVYVCQSFLEQNGWGRLARSMADQALHAGYKVYTASADDTYVEGAIKTPPVFDLHAHIFKKMWLAFLWRLWLYRNPFIGETVVHVFSEPHFWLVLGLKRTVSVGTLCGTYIDPAQHRAGLSRFLFCKSLCYGS